MRAILFDFNGVLVDDEPIHLELVRQVLAEEDVSVSAAEVRELCLGRDDREGFGAALDAVGADTPADLVARLVARKAAYYQMRMRRDGYPIFPGARELVVAAHDAGWMLGLVTGALHAEAEGALRQMGVRDRFKTVVASEDVKRGKPDPEPYRLGFQDLNAQPPLPARLLHPHEVLAVEDSPAGLKAAAALGLATLGIAQTHRVEELTELADHVVPSIAEVTPATINRLFQNS
ncbi:MAG: HAD family phosphatase [Acidobacteriota bacterium]